MLDVERLRGDFPALDQEVQGHPLVYLDNAATTQKPLAVLDAEAAFYRHDNANVHRGIHELSRRATEAFEEARGKVARFLNAPSPEEVVWTRGTTEAINLVAHSWGLDHLAEGDEIVLTVQEHHSNIVPWQLLAERTGARLQWVELDDEGRWHVEQFDEILTERTRLVACSHVSNSLGIINPVAEVARLTREVGALLLIDGAQGAPHLPVDVQRLGCDFYALSGHKMMGPTGIGALWARAELLEAMSPYQGGGEMIDLVERDGSSWARIPHKFEAGTPNIAGAVTLGAAVDYLGAIDPDALRAHEVDVLGYALERLGAIPGIRLFGPADPALRSGAVSFTLGDAHPHDISTILDSQGIAVRAGHHCTQLVMRHFEVAATARASFYLYNTREEVDLLADGLEQVRKIFG